MLNRPASFSGGMQYAGGGRALQARHAPAAGRAAVSQGQAWHGEQEESGQAAPPTSSLQGVSHASNRCSCTACTSIPGCILGGDS